MPQPSVLVLQPRSAGFEIESALTNTEKIVANLLSKQVILKERTPNCFVVL